MSDQIEVVTVVGTRPEIIKMAPVIRSLRSDPRFHCYLAHTNQHYDVQMSETFFTALDLPAPDENLQIGSGSHGVQTAAGIIGIETLLKQREPVVVLAQGDTNAVLSTAIAASKLPTTFGHIEAGIRSYDWSMPEEVNRVVADHVADVAFAPTDVAAANLADEGIQDRVYVTGNTVVDSCLSHLELANERSTILSDLDLTPGAYAVATIHRPQNTDDPERLRRIVSTLDSVSFPVVFPAHPRTSRMIERIGYEPDENVHLIEPSRHVQSWRPVHPPRSSGSLRVVEPAGYLDFLALEANARVIVTDSGGIQEEASILQVPCLTVRPNTERPETVDAGVNTLLEPGDLHAELLDVFENDDRHDAMTGHPDLYGDGETAERILDTLAELHRSVLQ